MSRPAADAGLAREVKAGLDSLVVTVELTLISIIRPCPSPAPPHGGVPAGCPTPPPGLG